MYILSTFIRKLNLLPNYIVKVLEPEVMTSNALVHSFIYIVNVFILMLFTDTLLFENKHIQ